MSVPKKSIDDVIYNLQHFSGERISRHFAIEAKKALKYPRRMIVLFLFFEKVIL
jgi:hypothetical protein